MLRERVRLDPGTRSKAAPPVRDLTDRRPPLRRRRQAGERDDAEGQELAGHRPIVLREPVDDRPPLERRRRHATSPDTADELRKFGDIHQEEQDSPSADNEGRAQPTMDGEPKSRLPVLQRRRPV